jgi:tRNA threonylcarbamoyl adenosine modification protein (Sua5/YciO/YrdC/YwlC family)
MTVTFEVDPTDPGSWQPGLDVAAAAIEAGQLLVVPTETVYGIAARPDRSDATQRVFEAKRRPTGLALPVLCATAEAAWDVATPSPAARALADLFWPGPLTMVLPRTEASRAWALGDEPDTVAVRVPDLDQLRALLERTGPVAATSANISGRPPLETPDDLRAAFGDDVAVYVVVRPGLQGPAGEASTVVDMTSTGGGPVVVRPGPVTQADLDAALGQSPRPGR